MCNMRKTICGLLLVAVSVSANGQSGTNSPYSQYGLGVLADQTSGFNRGMNGVGVGFREHNQVNFVNPASYSAMDSLTFIFDAGVSAQITNFNENGKKKNAKNADFEYAVAGFRMARHLGMSFGVLPFTNVGYNFSTSAVLDANQTIGYINQYKGSGGIHQVFVGMGWEPVRHLSVGFNASYVWGEINRSISNAYDEGSGTEYSSINSLSKVYSATARSYKLDFGVQYQLPLGKKDFLVVGGTFSPGHKMNSTPQCTVTSVNPVTSVSNPTPYSIEDALELPNMMSAGLMFNHNNQLKVGVDYSLQQWSKTSFPVYKVQNDVPSYVLSNDYFLDRHKVTIGGEYGRGEMVRGFFNRLRYRAGVSYSTPYVKINGADGPKELSVSAGFGIPIVNIINNRSYLNISAQWGHLSGKGLITENTFRINIGMTFNERWFMKWKVE